MSFPDFRRCAAVCSLSLTLIFCAAIAEGAGLTFTGVVPEAALGGYDAVERAQGHEQRGIPRHAVVLDGQPWWFVNRENATLFRADPSAYMRVMN